MIMWDIAGCIHPKTVHTEVCIIVIDDRAMSDFASSHHDSSSRVIEAPLLINFLLCGGEDSCGTL